MTERGDAADDRALQLPSWQPDEAFPRHSEAEYATRWERLRALLAEVDASVANVAPGARNLHARDLMDPTDLTIKPPEEPEHLFRGVGAAPDQAPEVVVYCRPSHRANSLRFLARHVLGWEHIRVYDGSWTEWGSSVVARGAGSRGGGAEGTMTFLAIVTAGQR